MGPVWRSTARSDDTGSERTAGPEGFAVDAFAGHAPVGEPGARLGHEARGPAQVEVGLARDTEPAQRVDADAPFVVEGGRGAVGGRRAAVADAAPARGQRLQRRVG